VTRHPDAGVLAEFREGLLGRRRSARVRAHLAACPHCASADAGLAEVTELLASSPAPRMPEHLIARLDSALAAEAASRQQATGAGASTAGAGDGAAGQVPGGAAPQPDGQPDSSLPDGHVGRRGRRPGWRPARSGGAGRRRPAVLGAAAAVMIVLAGAGYGLASLSQRHSGPSAATGSSAGRSGTLNPPDEGPHRSAGTPNAPTAGRAAVTPRTTWHVVGSKTDYQPGALARQAAGLARRYPASAATAQGTGTAPGKTAGPQLRACVQQITGSTAAQLVDLAHYRGQPATIIVQAPSAGQPGHVWVTGPDCSAQHHELLAQASLPSSG
jgi:hypothetical protein